jgi:bacterioferritin-associated ferredoxin
MDGAMYVCICNGVTEQQVREAADLGCASVAELTMRTGAGANCGSCIGLAFRVPGDLRGPVSCPYIPSRTGR